MLSSAGGNLANLELHTVLDPLPYFNDVAVSQHGRLIFQDRDCAWLYSSW
jgi:hypothetical protein